jgi:hypothetical protein
MFPRAEKAIGNCLVLALPMESGNFVVYSDASKKGFRLCADAKRQCYCLCFTPAKTVQAELSYT